MSYNIDFITAIMGARRVGCADASISFLLTDSRSLCFPEESLFFALRSSRNDGHRYLADLYNRGVRNFVVECEETEFRPDANYLVVDDAVLALQALAMHHRASFHVPVIGITGSNGKTMVKEWLYQILRKDAETGEGLRVTRSPRSYNSQIGVPLSVWLLGNDTELGIFEAGISEAGEMDSLNAVIKPTIAVLTNIGTAHQENFPSFMEKCKEKLKLFRGAAAGVYNQDDDVVAHCMSDLVGFYGIRLPWSRKDRKAVMFIEAVSRQAASTTVSYVFDNRVEYSAVASRRVASSFTIPFVDDASIENAITSATVALHLGIGDLELNRRMQRLEPVAMRLEVKGGREGCTLINDSYNSDLKSLDIALDFMSRRSTDKAAAADSDRPKCSTLILSDIEQSGVAPEELYREVSALAAKRGVRKFIGIGPVLMDSQRAIDLPEKYFFQSTEEFVVSPVFLGLKDELVLLKGARRFGFDRITDLLVEKQHETTLEVDLTAIVDNLNFYRSFLAPGTKLVCMIKADGYGAGAVEIAKTLQEHRVDYLAVAVADEGAALRRAGITANIMVMNPELSSLKTLFDYDLEPEVYSFRLLNALIQAAEREGITGWPVHIKLDTGMHRLGFDVSDMGQLVSVLRTQSALTPRSVFSHFVGSDSVAFDDFSCQQFRLFAEGCSVLQQAFSHKILRHICNSAGIEHFPEMQLDMCRLGLGLYGINPYADSRLATAGLSCVSTLKTTILQLRRVKAGESVGYSRRTVLERDSLIATIPIGYADGLNRQLGNRRGCCLVNGQRASYVGNICMDVAMIDVTDVSCAEGDSVEIFGPNLPVGYLSDLIGTIPYEILTAVSNRVRRVYYSQ